MIGFLCRKPTCGGAPSPRSFYDLDDERGSNDDGDIWCPTCRAYQPWKHAERPDSASVLALRYASGALNAASLGVLRFAGALKERAARRSLVVE